MVDEKSYQMPKKELKPTVLSDPCFLFTHRIMPLESMFDCSSNESGKVVIEIYLSGMWRLPSPRDIRGLAGEAIEVVIGRSFSLFLQLQLG